MLQSCIRQLSQGLLDSDSKRFLKYQADPVGYSQEILDIQPWAGQNGEKGQKELFEDIGESARLQLEGKPAIQVFRVDAGHGVGKTLGAGVLVNWFFDCFSPSICYTTAPTDKQVKRLLWKEIKRLRKGRGLPGTVLPKDAEMYVAEDHFAVGVTTSDNGGQGTARFQGQHGEYLFFVLDEAEGVPEFVFEAVNAMMTGGTVVICLMLANPQTRTSAFHRKGKESGVANYRLSVLDHPNVVEGREVVPGATSRRWAASMIATHCEPVEDHDEDAYTFEIGFSIDRNGVDYPAGTIWRPDAEFCFRVLGIAPASLADKVFATPGRYEAATKREPLDDGGELVRIGVDCARFGKDYGTVYRLYRGAAKRTKQIFQGETQDYWSAAREAALEAQRAGATKVSFRIDGTGGFGAGSIDLLKADEELKKAFPGGVVVHEVQFGSSAQDEDKYADIVTEMYAESAESLKGIALLNPPNELESDLTEREYGWVNRSGKMLRKLVEKEKFRKTHFRSPDDGDGFVLAVAPEFLFKAKPGPPAKNPQPRMLPSQRMAGIKKS